MRSQDEKIRALEQQLELLQAELDQHKEANRSLQQQYQTLKTQNDRLLRMQAEHESSRQSLMRKRIILSRAVIVVPENMIVGDRIENSVIKIYRGNNLTITDMAELINCRIIGLEEYGEGRPHTNGTIEIKGLFYNTDPQKFSISTHDKVLISPGARVQANICASSIVVSDLTRIKGRLATRELYAQTRKGNGRKSEFATLEEPREEEVGVGSSFEQQN